MTSEKIYVGCRVRPLLGNTEIEFGRCVAISPDSKSVTIRDALDERTFGFDHVFSPHSSQEDVYREVVAPMIESVMNGISSAVIAYGQTSSGKTHTMLGTVDDPGIIPRTANAVFREIRNSYCEVSGSIQYLIDCRAVQIYNERLQDMLAIDEEGYCLPCDIYEDSHRGLWVTSARVVPVTTPEEVMEVLKNAEKNRVVASTKQNVESSRSHAVYIITVTKHDLTYGVEKVALLYLVDLAGSEGIEKTLTMGMQHSESRYINASLLSLRRVIDSLLKGEVHVPYRDSKLTRLLKNSFGGTSRTSLIVCVSPSAYNELETLSTLRFGSSTRQIENKPTQSVTLNAEELERLIAESQLKILQAKAHLFLLQSQLERVTNQESVFMVEELTTPEDPPTQPPRHVDPCATTTAPPSPPPPPHPCDPFSMDDVQQEEESSVLYISPLASPNRQTPLKLLQRDFPNVPLHRVQQLLSIFMNNVMEVRAVLQDDTTNASPGVLNTDTSVSPRRQDAQRISPTHSAAFAQLIKPCQCFGASSGWHKRDCPNYLLTFL